jgi:hypothetical protein
MDKISVPRKQPRICRHRVADGAIAAIRLRRAWMGCISKYLVPRTDLASQPWIFAREQETIDSNPLTFDVLAIENTGLVIALIRRGL